VHNLRKKADGTERSVGQLGELEELGVRARVGRRLVVENSQAQHSGRIRDKEVSTPFHSQKSTHRKHGKATFPA